MTLMGGALQETAVETKPLDLKVMGKAWCQEADACFDNRTAWNILYEDCAFYVYPERMGFLSQRTPGDDRSQGLFTSAGILARETLSTGIGGLLRPPGRQWPVAAMRDKRLNDAPAVRQWLMTCSWIAHTFMYDQRAGFIEATREVDADLPSFGWGVICALGDERLGHMRFKSVDIKNFDYVLDHKGAMQCAYMRRTMTLKQIVSEWGMESLSDKMRKEYTEQMKSKRGATDKTYTLFNIIKPKHMASEFLGRDVGEKDMTYVSIWVCKDHDFHVLSYGGFFTMPYVLVRWATVSGEKYARCPAFSALPDLRTLNAMEASGLEYLEKLADPPVTAPADIIRGDAQLHPGGLTLYDSTGYSFQGNPLQPVDLGTQPQGVAQSIERFESRVRMLFYNDLIALPQAERAFTAVEMQARMSEMSRRALPVFTAIEDEYSGGILHRVFHILFRMKAFPPAPNELQGLSLSDMNFVFDTPLRAMREQAEAMRAIEGVGAIMQLQHPALAQNVNWDAVAQRVMRGFGLDESYIRPAEEVAQERAQQQQMAQMQMMAEMAQKAGPGLKAGVEAAAAGGGLTEQRGLPAPE